MKAERRRGGISFRLCVLLAILLAAGWLALKSAPDFEVHHEPRPTPPPLPPPPLKQQRVTYQQLSDEMTRGLLAERPTGDGVRSARTRVFSVRQILQQSTDCEARRVVSSIADVCEEGANFADTMMRRWQQSAQLPGVAIGGNDTFFQQRLEHDFRDKMGELLARLGPLLSRLQSVNAGGFPEQASATRFVEQARGAAENSARMAKMKEIHGVVSEVRPQGAVIREFVPVAVADRLTSVGLGGGVGISYEPGRKNLYVRGLTNTVEGQRLTVLAYPVSPWRDTAVVPARVLEQWVLHRVLE